MRRMPRRGRRTASTCGCREMVRSSRHTAPPAAFTLIEMLACPAKPLGRRKARTAVTLSELLVEIFGDRGKHARAAVGNIALPLGAPVEVEVLVEVE